MYRQHANVELYDGICLQSAFLSEGPSPTSLHSHAPLYVPHMYHDLAHAHVTFTHGLAQLQDEGAVNVHHLNSLYRPHPDSFQAMLDALRSENSSSTSWSLVLPALQAELMAYTSQRRAMSDICTPGAPWLATAVAGRLGSRATHGNTQVLAV